VVDGGVYDVRGPDADEARMRREFDSIVADKSRGKTKKRADGTKYVEKYEEVVVLAPNVGSPNVRKASGAAASAAVKGGGSDFSRVFSAYSSPVRVLLEQLLEENVHQITSMTTMTMTSSGLETPLGPVTRDHIGRARGVLDLLRARLPDNSAGDPRDGDLRQLNTQYFSLVPRAFGHKIADSDMILKADTLVTEYDLLDQMEAAVQVVRDDSSDGKLPDLGLEMELADDRVTETIRMHVDRTRNHHALDEWRVRRVFEIRNAKERDRYLRRAEALRQRTPSAAEHDLFHGSRNANILSILLNGFCVPPVSAPHVTGRMFGNGVYGADISTKALNYSTGYWNNAVRNKHPSVFLFVSRFAMGRVYETTRSLKSGVPHGYDSIFAKGGADLINNEYIVPDPAQATVTHLVEFGRR